MDVSSSCRTKHHQTLLPSSNQLNGHSLDTAFAAKKQAVEGSDIVTTISSELDRLLGNHNILEAGEPQLDEYHEIRLQRYCQLQEDVEVLASHMENQERKQDEERKKAEEERLALVQKNAALERELNGLLVERDALFKQNTRMVTQHAEDERHTHDAGETHEELLRTLAQQQQQTELLQKAAAAATQDRIEARKGLDKAQMHCRRLEEELSSAHMQVLHLQNERDTLQAALDATVTGATGFEYRQLQAQDETITSLRADLVQMEFELTTLSVDKATLEEQVEKLQLRVVTSEVNGDYEVVPLGNSSTRTKQKDQKKRTTIRPVKATKEDSNRRDSDLSNKLMKLPNTVSESPECVNATIWLAPSARYFSSSNRSAQNCQRRSFRERTGLATLVTKTVQSARKHIVTPLHSTFGIPH